MMTLWTILLLKQIHEEQQLICCFFILHDIIGDLLFGTNDGYIDEGKSESVVRLYAQQEDIFLRE